MIFSPDPGLRPGKAQNQHPGWKSADTHVNYPDLYSEKASLPPKIYPLKFKAPTFLINISDPKKINVKSSLPHKPARVTSQRTDVSVSLLLIKFNPFLCGLSRLKCNCSCECAIPNLLLRSADWNVTASLSRFKFSKRLRINWWIFHDASDCSVVDFSRVNEFL